MLFATQTNQAIRAFGFEKGIELLIDAGWQAIDLSLDGDVDYIYADDWKETAERIRDYAASRGVIFNQAHAPYGFKFDKVPEMLPKIHRMMQFCGVAGVKQIVIHPICEGRFRGNEEATFAANVEYYKMYEPFALETGVKVAIENMYQSHAAARTVMVDSILGDPHELARMYDVLNNDKAYTVCLDIGHAAITGHEPDDAIRILGHDRLGSLHVQDVDYISDMHVMPGSGKLNWYAICKALVDIRYKGEFTLEADASLAKWANDFKPTVMKYMADVSKYLVSIIEKEIAAQENN